MQISCLGLPGVRVLSRAVWVALAPEHADAKARINQTVLVPRMGARHVFSYTVQVSERFKVYLSN